MPNLASLYGAMLAGVDYVVLGAGIPREVDTVAAPLGPEHLDRLEHLGHGGEPRIVDATRPGIRDEDAPHAPIFAASPARGRRVAGRSRVVIEPVTTVP